MDAKCACLVVAGGEYAAAAASPSNGDGFVAELRVVADFDGCVEAVHVDVDDLSFRFQGVYGVLVGGRLVRWSAPALILRRLWFVALTLGMAVALSKTKLSGLRKFLQKKTRERERLFFVEGWHLLDEALKSGRRLRALVFDPQAVREPSEDRVLEAAFGMADEVLEGTGSQLAQLSDTKASQGVLALVESVGCSIDVLLGNLPEEGPVRLVVLDELGDPGNCGSIVRACDWFGIDGVVFGEGCAELENGKTTRSTMGGLFHLPVAVGAELPVLVGKLREAGVKVYTTELDDSAESLDSFEFPERCAIVIGNEARGVSVEVSGLADGKLFVPRFGQGESLNAAAAAAVFLAKWRLG